MGHSTSIYQGHIETKVSAEAWPKEPGERPKVALGMPAGRRIDPDTMFSLMRLRDCAGPLVVDLLWESFLYIDQARNHIVQKFLGGKGTHLLFLDSDMTWPEDVVRRLLRQDKPVVGGLYFLKTPPYNPIAADFVNWPMADQAFEMLQYVPDGLTQVDCVGTGCCLIKRRVLEDMKGQHGDELWFRSSGDALANTGEDIWFFSRCKAMKESVWLDPSVECGHITRKIVTRMDFLNHREKTWKSGRDG